jgi:hypothetical protein
MGHKANSKTVYGYYTSRHEQLNVVSLQLQKQIRKTDSLNILLTPIKFCIRDSTKCCLSAEEQAEAENNPRMVEAKNIVQQLQATLTSQFGANWIKDYP